MIRSRWRRLGSRSCLPLFTHLQRGSPAPQVGCPILPMHRMFQECGVSDNSAGVHPRVHSRPQDDERAVRQCCGGDHVREGGTRGCAGRMYHGEADQKHCCEMMTQSPRRQLQRQQSFMRADQTWAPQVAQFRSAPLQRWQGSMLSACKHQPKSLSVI